MKNLISYRYFSLKESLKIISKKEEEDLYSITLKSNKKTIGKIELSFNFDYYWYFEDDISEDRYIELFPDDKFISINNLEINYEFKNKGYAKKLIQLAIDKAEEFGYDRIYLNACPLNLDSKRDLPRLIKLYESFGFKVFLHQENNALMIKNLE